MFRQAFAWVLDLEPDLVVVTQAGSLAEGRARVAAGGADVALVLPGLPNEDWTRHVRELREADPPIPVLLAIVLGPIMEEQFRRALIVSGGDPSVFFTHPIGLVFILLAVAMLFSPIIRSQVFPRVRSLGGDSE